MVWSCQRGRDMTVLTTESSDNSALGISGFWEGYALCKAMAAWRWGQQTPKKKYPQSFYNPDLSAVLCFPVTWDLKGRSECRGAHVHLRKIQADSRNERNFLKDVFKHLKSFNSLLMLPLIDSDTSRCLISINISLRTQTHCLRCPSIMRAKYLFTVWYSYQNKRLLKA